MAQILRVLVELRPTNGDDVPVDLPGFVLDSCNGSVQLPADDSDEEAPLLFRGSVAATDLEALRLDARVAGVYLDTSYFETLSRDRDQVP